MGRLKTRGQTMISGLIRSTYRGRFFILLISMLVSQAFAQSSSGLAVRSHTVYGTTVGSAMDQPSRMAWKTEIEIPGTKQTVDDLTAASYFKDEINTLLNQLDEMDRGWLDTDTGDVGSSQTSQTPQASAQPPPAQPAELEHPDLIDGTMSVEGDLADDNAPQTSFFRRQTRLDRWFAWKRKVQENHGFSFGGSWGVLWQNFTNARNSQPNAIGSKLTLNFSYVLLNRRKPNALTFDLAVEDRRPLGTNLPPLQGGFGAGSAVPTAATWGIFDHIGITQAYIRQTLAANRFQWTIGKIFAPNYLDAFPFFDDNRQFLSQAFSTSPTIPSPLRGFGWVVAAYPTNGSLYLKSGMFTTHSDNVGSTISDFFSKNEHFYMFEVGSTSLARTGVPIQARGPMDANNVHLTWWYRNALSDGSPRSYGLAFNANRMAGSQVMWLVRSGWSVGFLSNWALSGGVGWRSPKTTSDLFGTGLGWARPVGTVLRSQYTWEAFYRFHVTTNFALTPDFQLVLHPSLNPNVDTIWVTSLRGRLTF
jgi:porin